MYFNHFQHLNFCKNKFAGGFNQAQIHIQARKTGYIGVNIGTVITLMLRISFNKNGARQLPLTSNVCMDL